MIDSIGGVLVLSACVGAVTLFTRMRDNRAHNKAEAKRRKEIEAEEARRASLTEEEREAEDIQRAEERAEELRHREERLANYKKVQAEEEAMEKAEKARKEELEAKRKAKQSTEEEDEEYESKFGDGPVSIYDLDSVDDLDELTDEQYDDVAEQLEEWAEKQEELVAAIIIAGSMR